MISCLMLCPEGRMHKLTYLWRKEKEDKRRRGSNSFEVNFYNVDIFWNECTDNGMLKSWDHLVGSAVSNGCSASKARWYA